MEILHNSFGLSNRQIFSEQQRYSTQYTTHRTHSTRLSKQLSLISCLCSHSLTNNTTHGALLWQLDELSGPATQYDNVGLLLIIVELVDHIEHNGCVVTPRRPHYVRWRLRTVRRHSLSNTMRKVWLLQWSTVMDYRK